MTADSHVGPDLATTASDYDGHYYNDAHLGGYGDYGWESDHWRGFFTRVAQRIIGLTEPTTVLDVGCAKGLLVQALAECGVDSSGSDISEFAVNSAHPDVRDRLRVVSATEPIEGRFDLITCVEVLEHMSPADAQLAIDSMCGASDRILFSSTPADFHESTHINVRPTSQWAAWFAERGFFRRTDCDTSFLTPWAVLFERGDVSKRTIVERYEALLSPLALELSEKRRALLEMNREVSAQSGARARAARLEDQVARLRARVQRLRSRIEARDRELASIRSSRTWRVGRVVTGPLSGLRPGRQRRG